jgi:hypothetical protein
MDAEQREFYGTHGYLVVKDAIDPQLVARLNGDYDERVAAEAEEEAGGWEQLAQTKGQHNLRESRQHLERGVRLWSPAWEELIDPPRLVPIIRELMNDDRWGHSSDGVPPTEHRGKFRLDHVRAWPRLSLRAVRGRPRLPAPTRARSGVRSSASVGLRMRRTISTTGLGSCPTTAAACTQATAGRTAGCSRWSSSSRPCSPGRAASAACLARTATTLPGFRRTTTGGSPGTGRPRSSVGRSGRRTCRSTASRRGQAMRSSSRRSWSMARCRGLAVGSEGPCSVRGALRFAPPLLLQTVCCRCCYSRTVLSSLSPASFAG